MKTLQTLFLAAAAISFAACSDDDNDNNGNNTPDLQGVYELTSLKVAESVDFNMDGIASDNLVDESICYDGGHITLNADNTFTAQFKSVLILEQAECIEEAGAGTWSVSGNSVILLNSMVDPPVSITYEYNNGMLIQNHTVYVYPDRDEQDNPVYSEGPATLTYTKATTAQ